MIEVLAGVTTLSLFLAWRLYVVSHRLKVADVLLRAIVSGKVEVQQTDDGFQLKVVEAKHG